MQGVFDGSDIEEGVEEEEVARSSKERDTTLGAWSSGVTVGICLGGAPANITNPP